MLKQPGAECLLVGLNRPNLDPEFLLPRSIACAINDPLELRNSVCDHLVTNGRKNFRDTLTRAVRKRNLELQGIWISFTFLVIDEALNCELDGVGVPFILVTGSSFPFWRALLFAFCFALGRSGLGL